MVFFVAFSRDLWGLLGHKFGVIWECIFEWFIWWKYRAFLLGFSGRFWTVFCLILGVFLSIFRAKEQNLVIFLSPASYQIYFSVFQINFDFFRFFQLFWDFFKYFSKNSKQFCFFQNLFSFLGCFYKFLLVNICLLFTYGVYFLR